MHPFSDNEPPPHANEAASPEQSVENVVSGLRALSGASPPIEAGLGERTAEVERLDLLAAIYDDLYEIRQPCFRAYEDWIAEAIYSAWYEGRGRLLVVGCGTGTLLQRLAQRMPAKLITGIDLSPQMTRRAREKVPAVPEIRTVAFEKYRPVVPFDVIAFNGSLAAMPDLRAAAEHIAGMTVHGSRIVISVRNGDWIWQDPGRRRIALLMHPGWYRHRLMNAGRIADIAKVSAPLASPHPLLTARQISEAFEGRFGLRDQRSGFGVTRLFESVIAVPREQGLKTVGLTREDRPWMKSVEQLWRQDEAFAKRHPIGGGILAMLFDMLH